MNDEDNTDKPVEKPTQTAKGGDPAGWQVRQKGEGAGANTGRADKNVNYANVELSRRKFGLWIGVAIMCFMGFMCTLFFYAALFCSFRFLENYYSHGGNNGLLEGSIVSTVAPLVPAALTSISALVILITASRFAQAFFGNSEDSTDENALIGKLVQEIFLAIRKLGSGGN